MKCKYCGAPIDGEDAFCRKCGARVPEDGVAEEASAPADGVAEEASAPSYRPEPVYDRRPFSGKAIAGFVVSLVGVVTYVLLSSLWVIWLPCSIVGLLLSMYATKDTAKLYRGKGLAIAGLVMATFTLVFAGTILLLFSGYTIIKGQMQ